MTDPPSGHLERLDLDVVREGLEAAVSEANDAIRRVLEQRFVRVGHKPGEGPVTEADHAADRVLRDRLVPLIEGSHWLSEESVQVAPLIRGEPTWVVDPLDGTREFLRGLPEFGVSAGLFVDNVLVLGAIGLPADPAGPAVLSGLVAGGRREARRDGEPLPLLSAGGEVQRVVVSRHDYEYRRLHYRIPYDVYPCGSAVVKLAHAAAGRAVYFSTGWRSVWDVAGGAAVLRAVGGDLLMLDGRPLPLSPQQVEVPPYAAGAPESCRTLLLRLGADV